MRSVLRASAVSALATAAIAAGGVATTASAQPVAVGNLVNVQITNVLNNNQVAVQVPISAAAAICGVTVAVLAAVPTGTTFNQCPARSGNQTVTVTR